MSAPPVIAWMNRCFRLEDNPLLLDAARTGAPVIPLFIDCEGKDLRPIGGASRWWLLESLTQFDQALSKLGSRLIVRQGDPRDIIPRLVEETGASRVCYDIRYEPGDKACQDAVKQTLKKQGIPALPIETRLLVEPDYVTNSSGKPYRMFTPFFNACLKAIPLEPPQKAVNELTAPDKWPESVPIEALIPDPAPKWSAKLAQWWRPGEKGAIEQMERFIDTQFEHYLEQRDFPAIYGTSRLSPHMHFGEIGPSTLWYKVVTKMETDERRLYKQSDAFVRQLFWREFSHYLLYHFPHTVDEPLKPEYANIEWNDDADLLRRWQQGRTGYPFVDAGMHELWETGWMHNRVRMVVGSFLVKDLLICWQDGERWFWDTLVDADQADNSFGWQWVTGSGADAAPYFRIFNPVRQGEKFDPDGDYIRQWLPVLKNMPDQWIHKPWEAPEAVLKEAGVVLGKNYPLPIVNHTAARIRALAAFEVVKKQPVAR